MVESITESDRARLSVRNVGGIERTSVELDPGITVLEGRNATNRTSFLQAIMAACGSDHASLKGDADSGRVELDLGGETYARELTRESGGVSFDGDSYLDDPTVADLFAFLLESNEARRAVVRGEDLRDLVMRPVDTAEIRAEIENLTGEKRRLDEELEELEALADRLPDLRERREDLEADIEAKREAIAEKQAEIDDLDADLEGTRTEREELDSKTDELQEVRFDIETQEESLDSLREEREEIQAALADLPEEPEGDPAELESRIERLRGRREELTARINELQRVIEFNEDLFEDSEGLVTALRDEEAETDTDALTEQLLPEDERSEAVVCWTCGTEVERDRIEETTENLRELVQNWIGERRDIEAEIESVESDLEDYREQRRERERREDRLERVEAEIADREADLESLRERETELADRVADLEDADDSAIIEKHRELNELEFELEQLESDLADLEEDIADAEDDLERREEVAQRREEVQDDLEASRSRIETLETDAVERFNEHMAELLGLLEYGNLERVWIERVEREVREGRQTVTKGRFDLHVVRAGEGGTVYEDRIEHLSESEREVVGLVFALAGYLVHDVHETCPFMLLDSLEAIDAERIARLVRYFGDYAPYLVVALLPEDAAGLDEEVHRVTDI